jgi:NAD+ diphosphatase
VVRAIAERGALCQFRGVAANTPNIYVARALDRMAHRRGDEGWIRALLTGERAVVIPVWRSKNLVAPGNEPRAIMLPSAEAAALCTDSGAVAFLGMIGETPHFAVDLSHVEDPFVLDCIAGKGEFVDLRTVGSLVGHDEAALLAYARGLFHWHRQHRFCGACGSPTVMREAGHQRLCTNPQCGTEHFPRTDPAIIVLVSRGDHALLGRKREWPAGMYSTIAGFVEPGESLEGAVEREVMEETGIKVADVRYHSSQPWPFPASLMLGYYARAVTDNIDFNGDELEDARWFSREELAAGAAGRAARPRSDSIARRLIDEWLTRGD